MQKLRSYISTIRAEVFEMRSQRRPIDADCLGDGHFYKVSGAFPSFQSILLLLVLVVTVLPGREREKWPRRSDNPPTTSSSSTLRRFKCDCSALTGLIGCCTRPVCAGATSSAAAVVAVLKSVQKALVVVLVNSCCCQYCVCSK